MPIQTSSSTPRVPAGDASALPRPVLSADESWAAWRSRGIAHDLAVRRKMMVAAPIVVVLIAVLLMVIWR